MSASIKVKVSRSLKGKSFQKLSNNAKQNQRLNSGVTAANAFYLLCGYVFFRLKQAQRRVEKLIEENAQLQTEKAVAQTQIKHHQVRQKNEENIVSTSRERIIDRLHNQNDLRD